MTGHDTDDSDDDISDSQSPGPPSGKTVTALLREARSLSRRADKLNDSAAVLNDTRTQQLSAAACTGMDDLVHHLMILERQLQRGERTTFRRTR